MSGSDIEFITVEGDIFKARIKKVVENLKPRN